MQRKRQIFERKLSDMYFYSFAFDPFLWYDLGKGGKAHDGKVKDQRDEADGGYPRKGRRKL